MCIFILQTMSVEPNFGKSLNKKFEGQDTLPQTIRIPGFRGSYADFLLIVCLRPRSPIDAQILLTVQVHPHFDNYQQSQTERRVPGSACSYQ